MAVVPELVEEYARLYEDGIIKVYPGKTLSQVIAFDRSSKSNQGWRKTETKVIKRLVSPDWEEVNYDNWPSKPRRRGNEQN